MATGDWVYFFDKLGRPRYRNLATGQFLSASNVLALADEAIAVNGGGVAQASELLLADKLSVAEWVTAFRKQLKIEYSQEYLLGRGGIGQMTQSDYGRIGGLLRDQYRYLDRFAKEVAEGNLSPGQIRYRSDLYAKAAREAYERGLAVASKEAGNDEEIWILDPAVENCPGCVGFAGLGWVKIEDNAYDGAYPGSGATVCLTNCHCHIEYRKAE